MKYERNGAFALGSTLLSVEMVKIAQALGGRAETYKSRVLRRLLEDCQELEERCRRSARRRKQTYGLLYKQGHFNKTWRMRLFVLEGGSVRYYQLGELEPQGGLQPHAAIAQTTRISSPIRF